MKISIALDIFKEIHAGSVRTYSPPQAEAPIINVSLLFLLLYYQHQIIDVALINLVSHMLSHPRLTYHYLKHSELPRLSFPPSLKLIWQTLSLLLVCLERSKGLKGMVVYVGRGV